MNIAAIMATYNEADIVGDVIEHLFDQGVDGIFVVDGGSTDGTIEYLEGLGGAIDLLVDTSRPFRQAETMTNIAAWAGERGADWVIPVDADEFWSARPAGFTIRKALAAEASTKVYAKVWHHVDRDHRWPTAKLQKVAFRWQPGVTLKMGNHDCSLPGGTWGLLEVRELQFRGFDHYVRKVAERLDTLDPTVPAGDADHYRQLAGLGRAELERRWAEMMARPTVYDPIPC